MPRKKTPRIGRGASFHTERSKDTTLPKRGSSEVRTSLKSAPLSSIPSLAKLYQSTLEAFPASTLQTLVGQSSRSAMDLVRGNSHAAILFPLVSA